MPRGLEVTTETLNLRAEPSTTAEILDKLKRGTFLLQELNGFTPVILDDDSIGWVSAKLVKDAEVVEDEDEDENLVIGIPNNAPWMREALLNLGEREISGPAANQKILEFFMYTTFKPTRGDEDPWCSGFACAMMERGGYKSTRSAAAVSWLKWGVELDHPVFGCVCVFDHHVNFFHHLEADGRLGCLGGNQSNSVNITSYNPDAVLSYRWPKDSYKLEGV